MKADSRGLGPGPSPGRGAGGGGPGGGTPLGVGSAQRVVVLVARASPTELLIAPMRKRLAIERDDPLLEAAGDVVKMTMALYNILVGQNLLTKFLRAQLPLLPLTTEVTLCMRRVLQTVA